MKKQNNRKGINVMDNTSEITKGLTTGITLIALVVTVIIILILAGVSISGLAGDNGLIAKTISAKEEAKISELQEKLELKKVEYVTDEKEPDIGLSEYIEYINDKKLIDKNKDVVETGEANSKYVALEDEYVFLVEKILETGELKITYQGKVGKLKPIIVNIEVLEKSTNSIKVQVNTRLTKNETYTYYIAKENEEYKEIKKQKSNIYKYTGLEQGKKYKIKVEVEIKDVGKSSSEITESLGSVDGLTESNTTFTYSPSGWTNGNVEVTIETKVTGYTLQYKTEKTGSSGEVSAWTNYTGTITLTRNQAIYARVVDSTGQSTGYATGNVEKIDKLAPNGFTPTATVTTNKINVVASSTDAAATSDNESSGISGYRFSKNNGTTWTNYQTSGTYTFTGLSQTTTYNIKVEAKDNAGNTTIGTISKGTGTVTGLTVSNTTFTYSPSGWTNGNVAVTITTTVTGYTLQYKTEKTGSSGEVSAWTNYTGAITLTRNQAIYARVVDSTGQSTGYATGNVEKIDKLAPTIGAVSGTTATGNTGTITISSIADTGGSGLKGIYISAVNTSTAPTATSVTWTANTSSTYAKTVSANGTYYVWVIDNANNISSVKSCTVSGIVSKVNITAYNNLTIVAGNTGTPTLAWIGTAKTKSFASSNTSVATVNASTGQVTGVAAGTANITVTITNYDNTKVTKTCTVTVQTAVAQIGTTNYSSVTNAVSAAATSTITLLENQHENVTIPAGKNITLALNSKTLTGKLTNNGTCTVNGRGTIERYNGYVIENTGTLNLSNCNLYGASGASTICNKSGTLTVDGNLTNISNSSNDGNYHAIKIENGTVNIKNGNTNSSSGSTLALYGGILNISGGSHDNNSTHDNGKPVVLVSSGTLNMTGGKLNALGRKFVYRDLYTRWKW